MGSKTMKKAKGYEHLNTGDRVLILPGTLNQQCGVIVEWRQMSGKPGLFPVILWDAGYKSFASLEWGLRQLEPVEQLRLF